MGENVNKFIFSPFFGSDRSPRSHFVCPSVRPSVPSAVSCLDQSIFIFLAQIFKQSVSNQSAVSLLVIIPSEPKILRLVVIKTKNRDFRAILNLSALVLNPRC